MPTPAGGWVYVGGVLKRKGRPDVTPPAAPGALAPSTTLTTSTTRTTKG